MRKIGLIFKPESGWCSDHSIVPSVVCPSCQTEVQEKDIFEKRGSLGCIRCLKI